MFTGQSACKICEFIGDVLYDKLLKPNMKINKILTATSISGIIVYKEDLGWDLRTSSSLSRKAMSG